MLQTICPRGGAAAVLGGGCPPASAVFRQGHQHQRGGSPGRPGPATPAELLELTSVLFPSEQIEHRIQAAIGAGQRPSHFVDQVDDVQHPAVSFQQPCHVINRAGPFGDRRSVSKPDSMISSASALNHTRLHYLGNSQTSWISKRHHFLFPHSLLILLHVSLGAQLPLPGLESLL